jgi:hypothetical protein
MQVGEISDKLFEAREQKRRMADVLEYLDSALMPEQRKADQYGFVKIHINILSVFDKKIKYALKGGVQ